MLTYTICFIQNQDDILLLHRKYPPNQGKWNGVGGKIEEGELPLLSCLREIREEAGLCLSTADIEFRGIVTWNGQGGMYVFRAYSEERDVIGSDEGDLQWTPMPNAYSTVDVVSNIPKFLPAVLSDAEPAEHAFTYNNSGEILAYEVKDIPHDVRTLASADGTAGVAKGHL